jgi:hypothetical protein
MIFFKKIHSEPELDCVTAPDTSFRDVVIVVMHTSVDLLLHLISRYDIKYHTRNEVNTLTRNATNAGDPAPPAGDGVPAIGTAGSAAAAALAIFCMN